MKSWGLIAFADAGFGTSPKNHSIDSYVVISGDVLDWNGATQRRGLRVDRRCDEIRRVSR